MVDETVLSWDIKTLSVTTRERSILGRDVIQRRRLLSNVRGCAKSGCLLAVMGPSGSGKTSLLAALSQRLEGEMEGDVLLNGRMSDRRLMRKISGFMPQQDLSITCLTVLEHLTFIASLKLDRRVTRGQQQRIVSSLLHDLRLLSCIHTKISALSGGERRRLSLASQMVTDPLILFCDEVTTGLDSFSTCSVVNVLRELAARSKTIICSIHQPLSEVFHLFDQLCLLAPGGGLAYFGTVADARSYFNSQGMVCPLLYNPPDFYLSKLNVSSATSEELCSRFIDSTFYKSLDEELGRIKKNSMTNRFIFGMEEKFLMFYSIKQPTQKTQLRWLMWRATVSMYRDPQRLLLRFFLYMMIGLLVSSPYISIKLNQAGIQSLQGFHYAVITETIFTHSYSILHTFPVEIKIMLREINNGLYEPGPYYFAKALILLPRVVAETMLFCMIAFFTVEVEGGSLGFFMFSSPVVASAIASTAYGCCMSAMFESVSTASLLSVPVDFISYTFSGLFIHLSSVPIHLKWVKYISRFYYGMEAITIMQWRQIEDIPCSKNPDAPCIATGKEVLAKYGFSQNNLPVDFLGLLLTFGLLHFIGFMALRERSKRHSVY